MEHVASTMTGLLHDCVKFYTLVFIVLYAARFHVESLLMVALNQLVWANLLSTILNSNKQ